MLHRRTLSLAAAALTLTVLAGCATPRQAAPVAATIAARPDLSALSGMLAKAGLTDTLNGAGSFTVFAPSNDAFAKLPAKTRDAIAADPALLKSTLTYHVLPVKVLAADATNGDAATLNGAKVAVAKAGAYVTVEEAMVTVADIPASNGVVHVVDTVLIPPVKR